MALFGFLEALQEKTGEDVFVATYYATKQKDTGVVTSYSTWSEGSQRSSRRPTRSSSSDLRARKHSQCRGPMPGKSWGIG